MTDLNTRVSVIEKKLNALIEVFDRGIGTSIPGVKGSYDLKDTNLSLIRGMSLIKCGIKKIKSVYKHPD